MSPRALLLLPFLALAACETYPVPPDGPPADAPEPAAPAPPRPPARRPVDVYRTQSEIKGLHRVIGEVRVATDGRESPEEIRATFERQARSRNAQGVIIQDPADRPYAGSPGPAFDQPREITAVFIRYDDRRAGGHSPGGPSPYSDQSGPIPSLREQPARSPYSRSPEL